MLKICATVFIFSFLAFNIQAQTIVQNSYWLKTYFRFAINQKLSFHSESDEIRLIQPDRQLVFTTYQHLHYGINRYLDVAAGVAFSDVHQLLFEVPEWRPFEEFSIAKNIGKQWRFAHRTRLEERFLHNFSNYSLTKGYNLQYRWRFRPLLTCNFLKNWAINISDELMIQSKKFDQNVIYIGIQKRNILPRCSAEMGFMKQLVSRNGNGYIDRNILRGTVSYGF